MTAAMSRALAPCSISNASLQCHRRPMQQPGARCGASCAARQSEFTGALRIAPQQPNLAASRRSRSLLPVQSIAATGGSSSAAPPPPLADGSGATSSASPVQLAQDVLGRLSSIKPPRSLWRSIGALVLGGEALVRILQGKIHWKNTIEQLDLVGPKSLGVCLLTAAFVGMVFTIQFIREFAKLGLTRSVGGVLALALGRELTPVVTSIIVAGRVGSAFAAELGTMQVSEQTDSLRVLGSDPVDYLITPRVMACMIAVPVLNLLCFCMGLAASVFIADGVYDVSCNIILDSAMRALAAWDVFVSIVKSWAFGTVIATVSCSWGYTTSGGAKGVGESTTSAVVISLVLIFVLDLIITLIAYGGSQGDALKQLM